MKFLCDACERLVEPAAIRVDGAAALLRCPRCQAETRAEAAVSPVLASVAAPTVDAPAAAAPAISIPVPAAPIPPEERCPKCASAKEGRAACAKCGLLFSLYKPEEDVVPQSARRDFGRLLDAWGTPDAARLLAGLPVETVPHLGRLCRHRLADAPDDARAAGLMQKLHERTLALALAATQSEGMSRQLGGAPASRTAIMAVAALGIVAALALVASFFHGVR